MTKIALIIVNKVCGKQDKRCGATKDFQRMCWMFAELGFIVIHRFNRTREEILTEVKDACSKPSDCFVLVLSTHGEESPLPKDSNTSGSETGVRADVYDQMIVGMDGQALSVSDLLKEMDNNALKDIPKLCFIQACRSIKDKPTIAIDEGISVLVQEKLDKTDGRILYFDIHQKDTSWYDQDVVNSVLSNEDTKGKEVHQTDITGKETDDFGNMCVKESPFDLPDSDDEDSEIRTDVRGAADSKTMPKDVSLVAPVHCPTNCLVMYPVQPHKYALRTAEKGSLMFHYMFKLRNMLKNDGRVLPYLTSVMRAMSEDASPNPSESKIRTEIKMCGTVYHRLTTEVCLQSTHAPTKQFEAWKSKQFEAWKSMLQPKNKNKLSAT